MTEVTLPSWLAFTAAVLLICGGLLTLIGAVGLLRLQNFYDRMHPPTMGMGLGAGCILISSMLVSSAVSGRLIIHELAIALFIVLTAPVSAITLMRAAISRTDSQTKGSDKAA